MIRMEEVMLVGTKGIEYYTDYVTPINYYDDDAVLFEKNADCYRLVFIESGNGSLYINNNRITIVPLTVLCLNERDTVTNIDFECSEIHILCFLPSAINSRITLENAMSTEGLTTSDVQDRQFFLPFIVHNDTYNISAYITVDIGLRLKGILNSLKEQLFIQSDSWPCLTRSYFLELLFLVERTFGTDKNANKKSNQSSLANNVLYYLHNNYYNKIKIDDLAKQFHTNRTTLSKEFKRVTGMTIISYLLKIRVQIAAGMLRDTTLNVEMIMDRVGFHNNTHFNKVFKEYNHCLPKEYRKKFEPYP